MKLFSLVLIILFSHFVYAQKNLGYTEEERNLSKLIPDLENKIFSKGNADFDSLSTILKNIIQKTPANYTNSFFQNGKKTIKFWNEKEFESYKKIVNKDHIYFQNVFPYAHYLLAVIQIERGYFKDAFNTLSKGLKLEPDNPILLSEFGLLFTDLHGATKDTSWLYKSNELHRKAFYSRNYNTDDQKARALRGIGFNFIELGDFKESLLYYEKSLEFEESKLARSEIQIIKERAEHMANNDFYHIFQNKSNIGKAEKINSLDYFDEQKKKLPENISKMISSKYVYLWIKAAKYFSDGSERYQRDDFFNYPLISWELNQIDAGAYQIVKYLNGVSPDHYIELNKLINAEELLQTFHFEKQNVIAYPDNIYEINFVHKVDRDNLKLYFKLKE